MDKELKEIRKMVPHQAMNTNKEKEITKRNQIYILELKSATTEIRKSLGGFISRFKQAE